MKSIHLRPFEPKDLEQVLNLFYETIHSISLKYYNQHQVNTWAPENVDKQKWLTKLETLITYIAEMDGIIVGFGNISHEGYIDHLYTHKDYQGKGIALAILKKLEQEAHDRGIKELTTEASITAMPLAKRRGYEIVQEQRKMLKGVEFINYLMRKRLN